jgi:hypothetical protein
VITATNTWSGQANTVAGEVNTNATNAATSATASATARTAAEAAQAAAQSASNATQWVSGQAYVAGNVVWSPSNYLSYRAVGATSGTTDPSQSASWVLLAVDLRRFTNPLAQAISVQMTETNTVATGANGISVLSNANFNQTTNNFSGYFELAFNVVTTANVQRICGQYQDADNRWHFSYTPSTKTVTLFARKAAATVITAEVVLATALTLNQHQKIAFVLTREAVSTTGLFEVYLEGVSAGSTSIPATATLDISNTGAFQICGNTISATYRVGCSFGSARIFNRALTAAEVLDLSIKDPALADRGASQTPVYTSDFSAGADNWSASFGTVTGNNDSVGGRDDVLQYTATSTGAGRRISQSGTTTIVAGRRYRIRIGAMFPAANTVTRAAVICDASGNVVFPNALVAQSRDDLWVDYDIQDVAQFSVTTGLRIYFGASASTSASTTSGDVANISSLRIDSAGLVSELLASNAQSNTGQIFDTSGNKNHALLPASGATVVGRPVSQTREVRWTNTWAGTNELQYIGGVNQAILPANAYIESIVGTVSGATPHDIIVGDGSDTDRYVTITTGLAAGTTSFTLANRTTDGTKLKLTVDPDSTATMSIAWVISYKTLES